MTDLVLNKMAIAALNDFARANAEFDMNDVTINSDHKPQLPIDRIAVYCFFRNRQALKIGIAGPNSEARYRYQHYNPNSAGSTLAASILKHPIKIGIGAAPTSSIGDWITVHTDRINLLLPSRYGKPMLARLESFLHVRWKPLYEGPVTAG